MEPAARLPECSIGAARLSCVRGDRMLFAGLSLQVSAGEALQLAGPNGSGKSSLMRMLAGLLRPFSGEVAHQGRIALLDERPALDAHLPLGRALAFWARCDRVPAGRLEEVAGDTAIADLLDVPVRYLSTGQRKRAALARTIAAGAPIWLLDEPLNGLDTASVAMVEQLAARHCADGGICIAASHQPIALPGGQVLNVADFAR
ncbi:heme ABC exporter ATP-binding protein CcmA [Croceicoccus marinus]|jgi:heme exporter protein A|uniref:Heme ABC exporter ATP-binding protein CcmA n=1 Tax=Croceicoccus marinus TaxID=450378 RepID=A0A7G6VWD0_9SPHN|nr:heme ABC exporter ATP-binding protein CcmA [Croceicoccus marinus]QNE06045.1 heme ABC exporter ATP-binding protein CcmA [Croceicoccus marinus]